ncbi:MAG: penicillin acylase family protein [Parvularcula sp.]
MHTRLKMIGLSALLLTACSGDKTDTKDVTEATEGGSAPTVSPPMPHKGTAAIASTERDEPTIVWDQWGVPHIVAHTPEEAFYAIGWAQMRGRGDLLLHLMGQGRGRAAEYWGEDYLESDVMTHRLGIPDLAQEAYGAQGPVFAARLDAFAQGINDFAAAHPDLISEESRRVLPVTATDFLGHNMRAIHFSFVAGRDLAKVKASLTAGHPEKSETPGSNAWAIGNPKAANGGTMLLANPHLPWQDLFYFFEAHIKTPTTNAYGVTLIGHPFLAIAFNENLGWTHTVNTYDGVDVYRFEKNGDGYIDRDGPQDFDTEDIVIRVRQDNGDIAEQPITIKRTSVGPVLFETADEAYGVKIAGMDKDHLRMTEQYWDMGNAHNLNEFKAAMAEQQMPMFNTLFADRQGDIYYLFNALAPVRKKGNAALWRGILAGDDPDLRWNDYLAFSKLPQIENPPTGFVQNANETPWTATVPPVLDPKDYPADFIAPLMRSRPQQSLALLMSDDSITLDEMIRYAHSSRLFLADSVVDDLISDARQEAELTGNADLTQAADILAAWDRTMAPGSKGAGLFFYWAKAYAPKTTYYETPWSFLHPEKPPEGLGDDDGAVKALYSAISTMKEMYGHLDAPWDDIVRIRRDGEDLPVAAAPGDLGAFRVGWPGSTDADGILPLTGGTTYVAAISFADQVGAKAILPYGNFAERPDFVDSQWPLFSAGSLRDVNYSDEAVESSARFVERLPSLGEAPVDH